MSITLEAPPGGNPVDDRALVVLDDHAASDGLPDLRWQLHDLVVAGARTIVVDMSAAGRVGSGALAALLGTHRACRARGGAVVLRDPGRQVAELMQRTGLWRVFVIERSGSAPRSRQA